MTLKSNDKDWHRLSDSAVVGELCSNLKLMRLNKNWSQSRLAEQAGLDRVTISRMENGRAATMLTFVQVLRALDKLQLLNVFDEEPEQSPLKLLKLQEIQRQKASPHKKLSAQTKKTK
jgi:putative transcriptional regulator